MGSHSLIVIEPPAPVERDSGQPDQDAWGFAEQCTDLEGWLEAIRPAGPPVMEL